VASEPLGVTDSQLTAVGAVPVGRSPDRMNAQPLGAIGGFTRPFERIARFWRFDFIPNSRKSAYFENRVKSDSRRIHHYKCLGINEIRACQFPTVPETQCSSAFLSAEFAYSGRKFVPR
jgi:hypothetical protein